MKNRIGLAKVLFLLLVLPGFHAFAAPTDTKEEESRPTKQTTAVEFKVFDTASLLSEVPFACIDGYLVPCRGTEEACRCESTIES